MAVPFEHVADELKRARETSGLSQRALGARTGLTQAHVSRIENAIVDPRLSTLLELTRALGLEIALVPRARMPLVKRLIDVGNDDRALPPSRPLYGLDEDG